MLDFWNYLTEKVNNNFASGDEIKLYKKIIKVFKLLSTNPFHNSLKTHEIDILTRRYGMKVWQSYLENHKPSAGRIYWVYYPYGSITIIGIEPHPNDNIHSYNKITLSNAK